MTTPRYNVAPIQTVATVTDDGERHLEQMRWGLIPSWAEDPAVGSRLINTRAETLANKPAFRGVLRRRPALIPADGFYAWDVGPGRTAKQAVYVRLKGGEPFAFAGLWDEWASPEGGPPLRTCTIITTEPNALMASFSASPLGWRWHLGERLPERVLRPGHTSRRLLKRRGR